MNEKYYFYYFTLYKLIKKSLVCDIFVMRMCGIKTIFVSSVMSYIPIQEPNKTSIIPLQHTTA